MNAAVLMITMLGCLQIDTEVSVADMKTTESDDYKNVSGANIDTNMLATT